MVQRDRKSVNHFKSVRTMLPGGFGNTAYKRKVQDTTLELVVTSGER